MQEILATQILEFNGTVVTVLQALKVLGAILLMGLAINKIRKFVKTDLKAHFMIRGNENRGLFRHLLAFGLSFLLFVLTNILNWNHVLFHFNDLDFRWNNIFEISMIVSFAALVIWIIENVIVVRYYKKDDDSVAEELGERKVARNIRYLVFLATLFVLLQKLNLDYALFEVNVNDEPIEFRLSRLLVALMILLSARVFVIVIVQLFLLTTYSKKKIEPGVQFAFNKIVTYIIYVVAILAAFQYLGIKMTVLWGGAAALLVGVGLGLQQTFNDFFSGIILLFEQSIKVGDVLSSGEGEIGSVTKIGFRTSIMETRDSTHIVVPNSLLVNNKITNWSLTDDKVRFTVSVGVAYGSDTRLVKSLLKQALKGNPYIHKSPGPFVRFEGFGDSALDFKLYFFSSNYLIIEDIKSDIRFEIDRLFRENDIKIPFPQREIWHNNPPNT